MLVTDPLRTSHVSEGEGGGGREGERTTARSNLPRVRGAESPKRVTAMIASGVKRVTAMIASGVKRVTAMIASGVNPPPPPRRAKVTHGHLVRAGGVRVRARGRGRVHLFACV
jgi:hypothetical protein